MAVATAALIAAFALAGLPVPVGSESPTEHRDVQPAAFTSITIPATTRAQPAPGPSEVAPRSDGHVASDGTFAEPGRAQKVPAGRPTFKVPTTPSGSAWKKPRRTMSGYATFYDNGTTAMRLPRGTVIRVCGKGGCLERVVNDYGPQKPSRVIDMYRPDFFKICGCGSWSGTTWVTVSIY